MAPFIDRDGASWTRVEIAQTGTGGTAPQAQSKNEVRIKVTLEEEVEQQIVTFHLANSAGQKTKVFDLSRDEQPVEEEELTMQKDFKLTGSERKDLDYVQNGKTAVALGESLLPLREEARLEARVEETARRLEMDAAWN